MFDTRNGSFLGFMLINPKCKDNKYLHIDYLKTFKRDQGVGSSFIKFAENLSKSCVSKGHLMVHSSKLKNETTWPHIFYRKNGFKTSSKITNYILDLYISLGIKQPYFFKYLLRMNK